jgi:hypothetical protein
MLTVVLTVLLIAAATFRLTRLVAVDAFPPSDWLRWKIEDRTGPDSAWSYLVNCPWCLSIYIGAAVTAVTAQIVSVPLPVLVAFTASTITGLTAATLDSEV